ncbi:MAG TPA: hypothetical protein VIN09_06620 [Chloroflexota bacterium]
MNRFLLGVVIGVLAKTGYDALRERGLPPEVQETLRRANRMLDQARLVLEEARREVGAAVRETEARRESAPGGEQGPPPRAEEGPPAG